jgi:RNA polymerase sigma-70 factor (ECF subfamily)
MIAETQGARTGERAATDGEVVRRVVDGEVALFEVLMRRHNQRVYRAVRAILRDEAEVEDVMQQAYLRAYTHLRDFEGGSAFSTWLLRIAVNEALGRIRRRDRMTLVGDLPEEIEPTGAPPQTPEDAAAAREAAALLEEAIDRLPAGHRVVYMLREVEQLSTAETAQALGIQEDAVKVRLHRARLALRGLLEDRIGEAAPQAFAFLAPRCNRVVEAVLAAIGGYAA